LGCAGNTIKFVLVMRLTGRIAVVTVVVTNWWMLWGTQRRDHLLICSQVGMGLLKQG